MAARRSLADVDAEALDAWDFDVFFHTPDELVASVVVMFMRLGLTTHEACVLDAGSD